MSVLDDGRKRRRLKDFESTRTSPRRASNIFSPFRSIGYVSNHVPFTLQVRGKAYLVTTCVGKALQTYDCSRLNLLFVAGDTEGEITAFEALGDYIYAAYGSSINAYKRGKLGFQITPPEPSPGIISHILGLGDKLLVVKQLPPSLLVFDIATRSLYTQLQLGNAEITSILHPSTYLNKILLGKSDGTIEILNIRRGKSVYKTDSFGAGVTVIAQSPVVDIVGIGLQNGHILVHNIKTDRTLMDFHQPSSVTSLSFRTDGVPILASASQSGDMAFFNLSTRRLTYHHQSAHSLSISSLSFLQGQPLLLSTSRDNSIKLWIFDALDGRPRLLRSRSGHHEPPSKLDFYSSSNSHFLLSGSGDHSLRAFSLWNDSQTTEFSQGVIIRKSAKQKAGVIIEEERVKLSEITCVAGNEAKQGEWDNIITGHSGSNAARTWSWKRKALGSFMLPTTDKSIVKAVGISHCGNFGFVGSELGCVDIYNLQSGIRRRTLGRHKKAITGVASDTLNKVLITTSLDGFVKFWDFGTGKLLKAVHLGSSVTAAKFEWRAELLGVCCDDLSIRVLDVETMKVVREIYGHTNRVTDLAFSDDAKWIISSSLDETIRTWDLPTGGLIDAFRVDKICIGLAFSPSGDYLATAHVGSLGINLWSNRTMFTAPPTRHIQEGDILLSKLPSVSGEESVGVLDAAFEDENRHETDNFDVVGGRSTMDQLNDRLITMSLLPVTKWQGLLNLEAIKERNRAKEPPTSPEKAPFFLPKLRDNAADREGNESPRFPASERGISEFHHTSRNPSKLLRSEFGTNRTEFSRVLHESEDFTAIITHLKLLSPSQLDLALRSLLLTPPYKEPFTFLRALTSQLSTRRDFELVQAWMLAFLRIHSDWLVEMHDDKELREVLEEWQKFHAVERARLADIVGYCAGVVGFIRGI